VETQAEGRKRQRTEGRSKRLEGGIEKAEKKMAGVKFLAKVLRNMVAVVLQKIYLAIPA
jgi:hypothetical protein